MSVEPIKPHPSRSLGEWRHQIGELEKKGLLNALAGAGMALAEHPGSGELHSIRGKLLASLGRIDDAEASLETALRLEPRNSVATLRLALVRVSQGRHQEARDLARAAVASRSRADRVLARAGAIFHETGDHLTAVRTLAEAALIAPRPDVLALHEQALAGLSEDAEAGVAPRFKAAYGVALERLREGDAKAAEQVLRKLLHYCPAYALGWIALKGSLDVQGRTEDAGAVHAAWVAAAPRAKALADMGTARTPGGRGMVFDPRDSLPLVRMDQAMIRAEGPARLRAGGDSYLAIDPGGRLIEHDPVVSLEAGGEDKVAVRFVSGPKFVAAVSNAALVGEGLVVNDRGQVVRELLPPARPSKFGARVQGDKVAFDPYRFRDGLLPVRLYDTPAFLMAGPTDRSFGDWMVNFHPRLALAEAAELDCPVIVRRDPPGRTLDMLAALGVKRSRLLFHDPNTVALFPRLFVPSWPSADKSQPSTGVYDVYRRAALPFDGTRTRRLYLTRRNVPGSRPMLNEQEVCDLFARRGFDIVDPGSLSLGQVRSLFASASCVAGPFGSAFHNLAFCSGKPVNLVIMPSNTAFSLTEIALWHGELGLRFAYVWGESLPDDRIGKSTKHAPWMAPLEKLDAAIDRVLEEVERERGPAARFTSTG